MVAAFNTSNMPKGVRMFEAVCKLGLESIVSKKLDAPYKSAIKGVAENQKSEGGCRKSVN